MKKTIYELKPFSFKMRVGKLKELYRMGFSLSDILETLKILKKESEENKQ